MVWNPIEYTEADYIIFATAWPTSTIEDVKNAIEALARLEGMSEFWLARYGETSKTTINKIRKFFVVNRHIMIHKSKEGYRWRRI